MPYDFNFDLTKISRSFFLELAKEAHRKNIHGRVGAVARSLARRFKIAEITGLDVSEAIMLVEDLIDVFFRNALERDGFLKTRKRALLLPHCSRKFMDGRCRALFYDGVPTYKCAHCSPDCLISQAVELGERKGYDVYVLPGGSCIPRILKGARYDGVLGVACGRELRLGMEYLKDARLPAQGVPLVKNGCSSTWFDIKSLAKTL